MVVVFKGGRVGLEAECKRPSNIMDKQKVWNIAKFSYLFSKQELQYISRRLDPDWTRLAFFWALEVGNREKMAEVVKQNGDVKERVRFAYRINTYKQKMKETISSAKEGYAWAAAFPEDSDEMIDLVQGGEWAFKWAKHVGDEEKMESRISSTFWQSKFDQEVKDEPVSFASSRT